MLEIEDKVQFIKHDNQNAYAVIPYELWLEVLKKLNIDDNDSSLPSYIRDYKERGLSLIAAWRKHKGISQKELAKRMGISQPAMAQIEKKDAKPHSKTLEKVANALELEVSLLNVK